MLHAVALLGSLGVIEALQPADEVAGDPADTLETDSHTHHFFISSSAWIPLPSDRGGNAASLLFP